MVNSVEERYVPMTAEVQSIEVGQMPCQLAKKSDCNTSSASSKAGRVRELFELGTGCCCWSSAGRSPKGCCRGLADPPFQQSQETKNKGIRDRLRIVGNIVVEEEDSPEKRSLRRKPLSDQGGNKEDIYIDTDEKEILW